MIRKHSARLIQAQLMHLLIPSSLGSLSFGRQGILLIPHFGNYSQISQIFADQHEKHPIIVIIRYWTERRSKSCSLCLLMVDDSKSRKNAKRNHKINKIRLLIYSCEIAFTSGGWRRREGAERRERTEHHDS